MHKVSVYMLAWILAFGLVGIQGNAFADVEPGFFEEEFEEFIEEEEIEEYVEEVYEEEAPTITGCILDTEARVGVLCENWSARLTARLSLDALFLNSDSPGTFSPRSSGAGARAARIGIAGTFYRDWNYKLEYDFRQRTSAPNVSGTADGGGRRGRITDAYIGYKGVRDFTFQVGLMKTAYDLTQANDSRFDIFMEGFFGDSSGVTKSRYPAISAHYLHRETRTTAMLGAHLEPYDLDPAYDEGGDDIAFYGRLTHAPYVQGNWYSHVGVGGKHINQNGTAALTQNFRSIAPFTQAFIDIDENTLFHANNNGVIPGHFTNDNDDEYGYDSDSLYIISLEAAGGWKNYGGQIGYTHIGHDRSRGEDVGHHLFYVQGNWWITGERNAYLPERGVFGRVLPIRRLGAGGMGAVGLSLRYHRLNIEESKTLVDSNPDVFTVGLEGGQLWGLTAGITWKINPYIKLVGEYVHVERNQDACLSTAYRGANNADRCPRGDQNPRGVQLRAQVDF